MQIISAQEVYENDEFDYEFGLEAKLVHKPCIGERGQATHVYAMFKTKSGGYGYEVMSIDDIRKHAQRYSKSYGNGPWQTNFEEMAKKTVLKKVLKYAPLKSDFVKAMSQDGTVKQTLDADMFDVENTYDADFEDKTDGENEDVDINTETGEVGEI